MSNEVSKSFFCVFNNPVEHDYVGTPQEIVEQIIEKWCKGNSDRTCAVSYCISSSGLHHLHCVFEDKKSMRFSAIKKLFPSMNIEPTKGSKKQVENYIYKKGKWAESDEKIVCTGSRGELAGAQGSRSDLVEIGNLLDQGKTPQEIIKLSPNYSRYERSIKQVFFNRRADEMPLKRDLEVVWHVGPTGSEKTDILLDLAEEFGEKNIYLLTDFESGGFDRYDGQPILVINEFHGQIEYSTLLNSILSPYKAQVHSRYCDVVALWNQVHITSVLPPETVFERMYIEDLEIETFDEFKRCITAIRYYKQMPDGTYRAFDQPMSEYKNYSALKELAECKLNRKKFEIPF